ncbi:MAG TPA: TonB-dependent receptor [Noviherbaspirillum sp.]|uniref:TonB-dependent receptor plug domain-containing protein n=1 Tax=Noviherbaspirillum sp. TaxID=1926288 RepID=UPI002D3ACFE3|nr:TonB-dependent receptor [Noviherbaspirillum sp.]HYD93934.1 TonB-dependent receptor [Noviherbaspirillum sp.]
MPKHFVSRSSRSSRSSGRRAGRLARLLVLGTALSSQAAYADDPQVDLAALPIEQLLSLEVYSASRFVQKLSEAPSAVSVVTAADIKAFGWRTLSDILRSMRGLYVSNDRNYSYLGARGFLRPGDYNTRFLLLVDGNRNNDAVFDQAATGTEFMLDVDLIERVEFVPGPGSSIYGANAFFGVVNIITRRGRDMDGAQASVEVGSDGMRKARASYGLRDDGGAEVLLAASRYRRDGADLYFPEFDSPATGNGVARRLDHDRSDSVFMKGSLGPFSLSVAHSERSKGVPTASFSQVFNDPRSRTIDAHTFVDAGYRLQLAADTEFSSRLHWGRYEYQGDYVYDLPPLIVNRDVANAHWWGAEAKLVTTRHAGHKLVMGVEHQNDYRREQINFDIDPFQPLLNDRRAGRRTGIYLQDEYTLRPDVLFNAGGRYDHDSATGQHQFNPRLALIWKATPATTLKALYGTAFRAPNAYELYYDLPGAGGQKANPSLKAERIRTQELSAEHHLSPNTRVTASLFRNTVSDLITQTEDPADGLLVFRNLNRAVAHGTEVELEKAWSGGAVLRTGYSWQKARGAGGGDLVNSPRHLAKFNLSAPLLRTGWRAGAEAQYVGRRLTLRGETAGYWLANLTLSALRLAPGLELSASVYNLFDRRYADPGAEEHAQDAIRQDGRTWRLKLSYSF